VWFGLFIVFTFMIFHAKTKAKIQGQREVSWLVSVRSQLALMPMAGLFGAAFA
jgi:hypothetical protein